MTMVDVHIDRPSQTGDMPLGGGVVRFRPVRRRIDGDTVIAAIPFDVTLDAQGDATVELEPTTAMFVWEIVELPATPAEHRWLAEVPDSAEPVAYTDLTEMTAGFVPVNARDGDVLRVRSAASPEEGVRLSALWPHDLIVYADDAQDGEGEAS